MKEILLIVTILFSQINSSAQSTETDNCSDTARYHFKSNISSYPELEIKIEGEWRTYPFVDEYSERFDYECEEIELNGKGSRELIIHWSNAVYGTGGGLTTKGIQIWNTDNGTRLFNETVSCSDESFGRHGNPSYLVECQKQIEIINRELKVYEKTCQTEWSNIEDVPDPTTNCSLTTLDEGTYFFVNEELKKK